LAVVRRRPRNTRVIARGNDTTEDGPSREDGTT
jgi:hypothetical protein